LVLSGLVLPATVLAWLTAIRLRAAETVQLPVTLQRRLGRERSGPNPNRTPENNSETHAPASVILSGNCRHVLFVEDERHFAEGGRAMLQELGYRVTLVADANEALAVIRSAGDKIDCVVTDLSMPGMSGFDLGRLCQRLLPGVPVILMSSREGMIASELLQACGIQGLLLKPFTRQTLAEAVHRVLAGGQDLD
jgi:CheY-like chemotaxis protein